MQKTILPGASQSWAQSDLNQALVQTEELEAKVFSYENLSPDYILNYINLRKDTFDFLACLLDRFKPFKYWYGFEVKSISNKNQLLIKLMKLKWTNNSLIWRKDSELAEQQLRASF